MKMALRAIKASQNGVTSLVNQNKPNAPRNVCNESARYPMLDWNLASSKETYGEGLVQVMTEDDPLSLNHSELNEVVDVLQCCVEGRL